MPAPRPRHPCPIVAYSPRHARATPAPPSCSPWEKRPAGVSRARPAARDASGMRLGHVRRGVRLELKKQTPWGCILGWDQLQRGTPTVIHTMSPFVCGHLRRWKDWALTRPTRLGSDKANNSRPAR
eukprot:gene8113-biopygen15138